MGGYPPASLSRVYSPPKVDRSQSTQEAHTAHGPWALGQPPEVDRGGPGEQGFTDLRLLAPQGGPDGTPYTLGVLLVDLLVIC